MKTSKFTKSRFLLALLMCFVLMELIAQPGQSNSDRNTRVLQAIELALRDPNTPPLRKQRLLTMKKIIEQRKGKNPETLFDEAMAEALRRFRGDPDREFFDKIKPTQVKEEPAGKPATDFGKPAYTPPLPAPPPLPTPPPFTGTPPLPTDTPPSSGNTVPGVGGPVGFGKWLVNPCPDQDDPGPVKKSPTSTAAAKKTAENENLNRKAIADIDQKLKSIDKGKDTDRAKALEAMKKYIQDHIKDDPRTVLDKAAIEAKKVLATGDKTKDAESSSMVDQLYGLIKSLFDYVVKISNVIAKAMGTGLTTGNIANISVTNGNDFPITIIPQTFFIPSDGKYQSYVGRITDCITVPPNGTGVVPVTGFCTDVHTPPVPFGIEMLPLEDWIPVGGPFDSVSPGTFPQVLEDMNPTASPGPSSDGYQVVIITNDPQTSFTPDAIPDIIASTGYKPAPPNPDDDIIVTWPGTDIPIGGTFDPGQDPYSFASWIVDVVQRVEDAADVIQDSGNFPTPFSRDTAKEIETFTQQVIWEYTAAVTGDDYEKTDFADNVYDQFTDKTGVAVSTLPDKDKDKIDAGIDDFWNAFQAVGVEAKVISAESPGIGISDVVQISTDSEERCSCGGIYASITLTNLTRKAKLENEIEKLEESINAKEKAINTKKIERNINPTKAEENELKASKEKLEGLKKGIADKIFEQDSIYLHDVDITSDIAQTGDSVRLTVRATNIGAKSCHCTNPPDQVPDCVFHVEWVEDFSEGIFLFERKDETSRNPRYWTGDFTLSRVKDYIKLNIYGSCSKSKSDCKIERCSKIFQISFRL